MRHSALDRLQRNSAAIPAEVWQAITNATGARQLTVARRMVLLVQLWRANYQTERWLTLAVWHQLGVESYSHHYRRTFRRDVQALRRALAAGGLRLRYSREAKKPGYFIVDRPDLAPEVVQEIHDALAAIDPREVEAWQRLSIAQRMASAFRASQETLSAAIHQLMEERPELDRLAAQREALKRHYEARGT